MKAAAFTHTQAQCGYFSIFYIDTRCIAFCTGINTIRSKKINDSLLEVGDQDVIRYFVEQAPRELTLLEHWGCPWSRNEDGTVATRAFGGMSTKRTWYAANKVGFHMLHTLFQHSLRFDNIVRYDEHFATRLLIDEGVVRGVAALDIRTGVVRVVLGRAVILATGGAGKIFPFTTNASSSRAASGGGDRCRTASRICTAFSPAKAGSPVMSS